MRHRLPGSYRPVIFRHVQPPLVHVQPPLVACAGSRAKGAILTADSTRTRGALAEEAAAAPEASAKAPADAAAWPGAASTPSGPWPWTRWRRRSPAIPGTPMALAPAAYVLWHRFLRHNPPNPTGPTATDSCSPAATPRCCSTRCSTSPATTSRSTTCRASGSGARRRRGIPSAATRPASRPPPGRSGQGIGNAVGMAIAERFLAAQFNRPGHGSSITASGSSPATAT